MLKKTLITGISTLITLNSYASPSVNPYDEGLPLIWQPIIIFSAGPSWANPGQDQYIYPLTQPPLITRYITTSGYGALATGELFFGLQRLVTPGILGQLGLEYAGSTDAKTSGVTTVDGVPNLYTYSYKINHGRIALKGKLIANALHPIIQPYLSAGLGASFNGSHDYIPITNPLALPAPWFATNSVWGFTYTLGIGLQTMVSPHWQVGAGYEFADWGQSFLGGNGFTGSFSNGTFGPVFKSLALGHVYTNTLLFSVGYVF